jgi:AAA domain
VTDHTPTIEERWRQITRKLGALGYSREMIDAIPTEEAAWSLIEKLTPPRRANGANGHVAGAPPPSSPSPQPDQEQPQPERPQAGEDIPSEQPNGDAAEPQFDDDVYELPIDDPAAARIARDAVKAMRYGTGDKYQNLEAASRRLDPNTQHDAIDYLFEVATDSIGLDPDAVQQALARGQEKREQDRRAQTAKPVRFKLLSFDELKSETTLYLVKGLLPRRGLVIVWGPPKCGKSFWIFDVMMHIVMGWKYRGCRVHQAEIIYLVLEGQTGFGNRKEAFKKRFLKPDQTAPAFKFCGASLDLIKDHRQLIADIRAQHATPSCVVLDTLNRSLVGSESSDEDMAKYLKAAAAIEEAFGCLVVIIHHCGIDDRRPRGHTSQTGAADVQIAVKKDDAGIITATVEFAKDMPEGATLVSRLKVVELGTDPDGDPITSCVIEPVETAQDKPAQDRSAKSKPKPLPKTAQIALRALSEAIDEIGAVPPASNHIPQKTKTVTVDQWREYAYRIGISTGEDRAKQQAFKRASEQLIGGEPPRAAMWDGQVWVA